MANTPDPESEHKAVDAAHSETMSSDTNVDPSFSNTEFNVVLPSKEKTLSETEEGKPQSEPALKGIKFALVFVGLSLSVFLAALDQTIVSTTLNVVGNEFKAYTQISWVATAYLLTATGFGPSWGRLSDVFGRKYTFLSAILFFEIGSAICGAAPNINILIFGRAIAGLGGGGIIGLTLIIITDLVSIREAGKYAGIIGACFGLSSIVGPLLGGAFTDHLSWRWAYFINLPIGGAAAIVVFLFLNLPRRPGSISEKLKKLDYLGSAAIMIAVILVLIAINWGGSTYSWTSGQVLGPLIGGGVMFVVFALIETFVASSPIMPHYLFKNRTVVATFTAGFCFGGSFFGLIYFPPIFFQVVKHETATSAGLELIPLILAVVVCGMLSGIVVSKTGVYRPLMVIGMAIATVGAGLITTWTASLSDGAKIGFLFMTGVGFGLNVQNMVLVTQNAVDIKDVAVVTAAAFFFRTLGGTISIAIMQSVFNTRVTGGLTAYADQLPIPIDDIRKRPAYIADLPPQLQEVAINVYVDAITRSFFVTTALAGVATLMLLLMEKRPLRTQKSPGVVE